MRTLPLAARVYLIVICLCACTMVLNALLHFSLSLHQIIWTLAALGVLVLADSASVFFETRGGTIAMGVDDAPRMFLVGISGPIGVVVVALATAIVEGVQRRVWYKAAFNIASRSITYIAMVGVYEWLHPAGAIPFGGGLWGVLSLIGVAAVSYLSNVVLLALMIALATQQRPTEVYTSSFGAVHWVHLFTTPLGALCAAIWAVEPWLLLVGLTPLFMAQHWFVTSAALQQESQRNQQLAAEQTRLYEQLQRQQDELIRAEKLSALGTFASGIAHEFNNLLAGILGHAQLGLQSSAVAEKNYSLEVTLRSCERGRSITDSLLTFARRREMRRSLQQVRDAVEDTLKLVEHDLGRANIQVVRNLETVPPTLCDAGQLLQVLLNLITNATDAMRSYGRGTLTIGLRECDEQIELTVADTGGGIPDEVREQIFQPFYTTKEPGKGTGLGLALCYGIIEQHGGKIVVASTMGQGTMVTIRLPILSDYAPPCPTEQAPLPPLRMLLVDDDRPALLSLSNQLAQRQHKVQTAASGAAALESYQSGQVDVVICDANMPVMDGVRITQHLRAIDAHVPIIVLTGDPGSPVVAAMYAAGAVATISKPATVDEILDVVRDVLSLGTDRLLFPSHAEIV